MLVLGIDSATNVAGVAVVSESKLVAESWLNIKKTHSQRLMPMVANVLKEAQLSIHDVDGFAVTIGPGSFTGLRIGLATVKGLAHVTGKPLVGIPTLDALAQNAVLWEGIVCPVLNARKEEVYSAVYRGSRGELARLTDYMAIKPAKLADILSEYQEQVLVLGDGVQVFAALFESRLHHVKFAPKTAILPRAAHVAQLGLERLSAGTQDNLFSLVPIYIRPSEAEVNLAGKHGQGRCQC